MSYWCFLTFVLLSLGNVHPYYLSGPEHGIDDLGADVIDSYDSGDWRINNGDSEDRHMDISYLGNPFEGIPANREPIHTSKKADSDGKTEDTGLRYMFKKLFRRPSLSIMAPLEALQERIEAEKLNKQIRANRKLMQEAGKRSGNSLESINSLLQSRSNEGYLQSENK